MTDAERDRELQDLSLRVGDRRPIDWSSERSADPLTDATIEQLHALARIAELHRRHDPSLEDPTSDEPDRTWGRLRLIEKLGEGGGAEVWRAHDRNLQRDVALKLARPGEPLSVQRWLDEARRLAKVRHPNVVTIHGADRHGDRAGLWMELVDGHTLEELLQLVGPFGAEEAARVGIELCGALSAVHAAGLVHGDVKTRNVMRVGRPRRPARSGHVLLMDFGSALEHGVPTSSSHTPYYAAPELLDGGAPTVASDLHALGALLYRLTTARHPVEAVDLQELRERVARGERVPLRELRPDLPREFARVVETALAVDPSDRFSSALEMEHALAASLFPTPRRARAGRIRGAVVAGGVIGLGLGLAFPLLLDGWAAWKRPSFRVAPRGIAVEARLAATLNGSQTNEAFGAPLLGVGDVDGDGFDDFLVAAPDAYEGRGRALLLRATGPGALTVWRELRGDGSNEAFGSSMSSGDLDGDGRRDLVIGAPRAGRDHPNAGCVYVWFGNGSLDETADLAIPGGESNQYLGYDLDASADIDGDGFDDLCVGAPLDERAGVPTGRAFVFRGGTPFDVESDLDLTSGASYSQFGVSVKAADVDGDGFDDVMVGANWENTDAPLAGRVYVFLGGSNPDTSPDLVLRGPYENATLGFALPIGDVNGDATVDFAVSRSAPNERGDTVVDVHFGGRGLDARPDLEIRGPGGDDGFGASFGPAGDVNGDGSADFFVGAYSHDGATRNAGALYVYFGGPSLDGVADLELLGKGTWDLFGASAAPVSDPNGNGSDGLLIGSRWASDAGRRSGRVDWYEFHR